MAQEYIYQMEGLEKRTPQDDVIFSDIWLSFFPDAKIGVVGPNGSGKSTLLRIMAGIDDDYRGETWVDPDATVGYLAQEPELDEDATVRENVEQGVAEIKELIDEYNAVSAKFGEASPDEMNELIERQAELQDQIEAADGWEIDSKVDRAMEALRLPPEDAPVEQLSGGERRRVALCRLLLKQPDLMLLDEPTNHLDAETVDWLEDTLREWDGCVVIVTHDRYFLDNVTGWVLELEGTKGIPFEGNYSSWLEQKLEQFAEEGNEDSPRAAALSRELEWAKATEKARTSSDRLAELARREADDKKLGRKQRNITIPEGPRLGQNVIKAENLRKGYDDRLLVDNLSFDIPPGAIVGVIGPNGAGKSTLFRMITGEETPDEGSVEVGDTVEIASVDQMRSELDANKDEAVWEFISDGQETLQLGDRKIQARAYVGAFGLTGQVQQRSVGTLSGGERSRVQLAKTLLEGGNMLLLDEPENDLDMTTLQALEMALEEFTGSSMVISHVPWFLNRNATHIIAFEGNSQVVWFEGNYEAYEKDRRRRLGEAADRPSRIQYQSIG
jgi:ATP-binding cassette ChvD family protein